jgi:hypothetical protein
MKLIKNGEAVFNSKVLTGKLAFLKVKAAEEVRREN